MKTAFRLRQNLMTEEPLSIAQIRKYEDLIENRIKVFFLCLCDALAQPRTGNGIIKGADFID